jgi:hypothetical protein
MQAVFHLVYFSHASEDIAFSDIQNILQNSRAYNAAIDVTGLLIFRDGHFVQLLEGCEKDVKEVLGKILLDKRNHGLRVLAQFSTDERFFEDWSMAYVDGDISVNETEELVKLCDEAAKQGLCAKKKLIQFLHRFRDSSPNLS